MADEFELYDLKVEVVAGEKPFVCSLAALLPLLPAKQRPLQEADWMGTDALIACPDPNCGAQFKISRVGKRTLRHGDCTVVPLDSKR